MSDRQPIRLPGHLWAALDEMARDGAQATDALLAAAVEQFVALQGYDASSPRPAPVRHAPLHDDDEPIEFARTVARPAHLGPLGTSQLNEPGQGGVKAAERSPPEPVGATVASTGLAPTHVPSRQKQGLATVPDREQESAARTAAAVHSPHTPERPPAPDASGRADEPLARAAEPAGAVPAPASTESSERATNPSGPSALGRAQSQAAASGPAATGSAAPAASPSTQPPSPSGTSQPAKGKTGARPAPPPPVPDWVTRASLSDADEERAAARERMVAIDSDVARLTLERPSTHPLGTDDD